MPFYSTESFTESRLDSHPSCNFGANRIQSKSEYKTLGMLSLIDCQGESN